MEGDSPLCPVTGLREYLAGRGMSAGPLMEYHSAENAAHVLLDVHRGSEPLSEDVAVKGLSDGLLFMHRLMEHHSAANVAGAPLEVHKGSEPLSIGAGPMVCDRMEPLIRFQFLALVRWVEYRGLNPVEFGLDSFKIGAATTTAASMGWDSGGFKRIGR